MKFRLLWSPGIPLTVDLTNIWGEYFKNKGDLIPQPLGLEMHFQPTLILNELRCLDW